MKNGSTHCGQERKVQEELHGDSIATVLNSGQPGEAVTVQVKTWDIFAVMEAKAARRKQKRVMESGCALSESDQETDVVTRLFLLA